MPKHTALQAQDCPVPVPVFSERMPPLPLVCFSHLRWNFVYQRPQHLMSRFARHRRVYFVEEPVRDDGPTRMAVTVHEHGVRVAVPVLAHDVAPAAVEPTLRRLTAGLLQREEITSFVAWYYTPMAVAWTRPLSPVVTVYDCMDELSLFMGAPAELVEREQELLRRADVVFTGGFSLYEAKQDRHPNVHCFPSSIDVAHFHPARAHPAEPEDQAAIPRVRLGFAGVIDERMDTALLDAVAAARPEWHLVLVGPTVKIDPARLPRRANIHYLGGKSYADLPAYMAGWDVALIPFAMNDSTRFISPTKTPEYLAAGRPVVSTPIRDVVRPYGTAELVHVAETPEEFCAAVERALAMPEQERRRWLTRVDGFLSTISWDRTYAQMAARIREVSSWRDAAVAAAPVPSARRPLAAGADYRVALGA